MRPTFDKTGRDKEPLATASGSSSTYHMWALVMPFRVFLRPILRGFGVNQGVPTTQIMAPIAIARNAYTRM